MNRLLRFVAYFNGTLGIWQIALSPWLIDRQQDGIGLVVIAILLFQVSNEVR